MAPSSLSNQCTQPVLTIDLGWPGVMALAGLALITMTRAFRDLPVGEGELIAAHKMIGATTILVGTLLPAVRR